MVRITLCLLLICVYSFEINAQNDNVGSGRAIKLDGVDDYIDYGDHYHDLNLPLSVSAWVYIDPSQTSSAPIFVLNDNFDGSINLYRGIWFVASKFQVLCEFGDGFGGNNSTYRRGKLAAVPDLSGRWVNICVVMNAPFDMTIYVNGNNVGGNSTGGSSQPMAYSLPGDRAKSGYWVSNDGTTYRMKGSIDEVRLWNRALTESEIRTNMCKKLLGNEAGLIGYWNFDETTGTVAADKSPNAFAGQLMNNAARVYSGAPIGDESIYSYQVNWTGQTMTKTKGAEQITVSDIVNSPEGIHIYSVNTEPSQVAGLDVLPIPVNYFGVFAASGDVDNSFKVTHNTTNADCGIAARLDNSVSTWYDILNGIGNFSNRTEIIQQTYTSKANFEIDLGDDIELCPFVQQTLEPVNDPDGFFFLWQNGSVGSAYQANSFGTYWVVVTKDCFTDHDTITFSKAAKIAANLAVDLGVDTESCPFVAQQLKPLNDTNGFSFTWQNGSTAPTFQANIFGTYWVNVEDDCFMDRDTVTFSKAPRINFYFDFGEDKLVCPVEPFLLNPLSNPTGFEFTWQDGSKGPSLKVKTYGKYWVTVENDCAIGSDTIEISKPDFGELVLPNVFTPNDDQWNQTFVIDSKLLGSQLFVYNRWGEEVYASTSYDNNWNGNGLPPGIYYYLIRSPCTTDKKGWLSLIR